MERDAYLRAVREDPWAFPAVEGCSDPPPAWVRIAWVTPSVQQSIVADLVREVSQSGTLGCTEEFLARLSAALGASQVVALFRQIREESPHREAEFRPEFERWFAHHAPALPPPLTRSEVVAVLGLDEATAAELLGEPPEGPSGDGARP